MATRKNRQTGYQQAQQRKSLEKRAERTMMKRILLMLIWIGFGLGAIFYVAVDPQNNWLGVVIWVTASLLWYAHKAIRWIRESIAARAERRR